MEKKAVYFKIIINILLYIAGVTLLIVLLPKVLGFFWPFVAAWILASIANPLVRFMDDKIRIRRKHGTVIIIILVLAAVVGLIYGIIAFLAAQVLSLIDHWPEMYNQIEITISSLSDKLSGFYDSMPAVIQGVLTSLGESLENFASDLFKGAGSGGSAISAAGTATRSVFDILLNTIIMFVSAYFFIADRDKFGNGIRRMVPESIMKKIDMVISYFKRAVGGYFKAQFKIMLILIVVMGIWFGFMKVPYYALLALLVGFLDFLPVFGTGAVLWPWAVYCLITGEYLRAALLAALYVVCQLLHQLLQPKMVADSIGISPVMSLFLLFIGYQYKGVIGMIVALPVGLVVINFYRAGTFDSILAQVRYLCRGIGNFLYFEEEKEPDRKEKP